MMHPVDRYVNRLLRRRRPRPFAPTEDELAVVRTAIDLLAAGADAGDPRPAFVSRLRGRLAEQEQADEQRAESPRPAWRTPARRRVLAAGALTATGAAVGVAADRLIAAGNGGGISSANGSGNGTGISGGIGSGNGSGGGIGSGTGSGTGNGIGGANGGGGVGGGSGGGSGNGTGGGQQATPQAELSPEFGAWRTVVSGADLPEGAVLPFDLGAINGFLRRVSGRVQAVSGTCTHQGCRLDLDAARDGLTCPCHGATFTLAGANLTHPLQTGQTLPPLPRLPVREQNGQIQIYAPRST